MGGLDIGGANRLAWFGFKEKRIEGSGDFGLLGILNLTPDSFYDGGRHDSPQSSARMADRLLESGADIIDLGAESSRPGFALVERPREISRLAPALSHLAGKLPPEKISVDTWHVETALYAIENGAGIINDVSACLWEPELLDVIAEFKPGYVLTHNAGLSGNKGKISQSPNILDEMLQFFECNLGKLVKAGLPENHIALDPGIGFCKAAAHDLAILHSLDKFLIFGRPLLLGLSMKSFLGKLFGLPLEKRGAITAAASVLAWEKGVFWHRVHEPLVVGASLRLAAAMRNPSRCCQKIREN